MLNPGEQAELFADDIYQKSQTWKLSTSGLSAGHHFKGTGFGSAYHDGYGINCATILTRSNVCTDEEANPDLAAPDMIKFGIESKHSCEDTDTAMFGRAIENALEAMRVTCIDGMSARL
jgi:hypothetical protein